jgi:hypothetical protein
MGNSHEDQTMTIKQEKITPTAKPSKPVLHHILNISMILIGLILFLKGILNFLTWLSVIPLPAWLQSIYINLTSREADSALSFLGSEGILSATLGFWSVVSGVLLYRKRRTGWAMAIVILSTISLMEAAKILTWVTTPGSFDINYWPNWLTFPIVIIGLAGFSYLLATKDKYT